MGSYAAATAELDRLSGIQGIVARRHPGSATTASSAATDNRLEVKDSRTGDEDRASHAAVTEPLSGHGAWLQYEVSSSSVYPDSTSVFS